MIRDALEYIIEMSKPSVVEVGGRSYKRENLDLITEPTLKEPFKVSTLDALVEFIANDTDSILDELGIIIHVQGYDRVDVYGEANADMRRNHYLQAAALCPEPLRYGHFYDTETFNILLQSRFEDNADKQLLLQLTGNIKDEAVKQVGDNGITQSVTVKTGVTNVDNVIVPNPVTLVPRRTFFEIEQPASPFVYRMQSGPECALFEADGGAWKQEAIKRIADYLVKRLADALNEEIMGKIKIIA